jgi:hypothetical protein
VAARLIAKRCAQPGKEKKTMTADIKYTVKHHPLFVKKVASLLAIFGGLIILLLEFLWANFTWETLAISLIIPDIFSTMNIMGILSIVIGFTVRLVFKWRTGKIELTDDKLIINGSYYVSIWLKNMWEVDFRAKWRIRLDSNVDAVEIRFKTEKEFVDFSDKLIQLVAHFENVKFNTTT